MQAWLVIVVFMVNTAKADEPRTLLLLARLFDAMLGLLACFGGLQAACKAFAAKATGLEGKSGMPVLHD